ncbi:glycosyltransferase family 4 protein [Modestobacter lacusdianchii]
MLDVAMTVEQCWQPQPGGSGRYVQELAAELVRHPGLAVTGLAARHPAASSPADGTLPFPVHHSRLPRPVLYRAWQQWRRPRVGRGTDVVHATTWAIPGRRCPLVVTVHDLAFRADPTHFTRHGAAFFERGLDLVRREAAEVIVPSQVTFAECVAAGLSPDRLTVVPHGVRPAVTTADEVRAFRAAHRLERPYVLWTGTREPRKNLPVLLRAFDRLQRAGADLELVLVGPEGWGSADARLTGPVSDHVRVLGRLPRAELQAAYAGADVFCFPSLREGYGMPVTEAMAHGVPVVTSRGTATEEAAGGAAVLVDPRDEQDVAAGLAAALDPARRAELRAASSRRAAELSWSRAAEQTAAVLVRAAGTG